SSPFGPTPTNPTGRYRPDQALSTLRGHAINGNWKLVVDTTFDNFDTGSISNWTLSIAPGTVSSSSSSGNLMDQNLDGVPGEPTGPNLGLGDAYAVPTPTTPGSALVVTPGQFYPGPYSQDTLPLILPGPHIVSSHIPGAPVTSDNLVQNTT